MSDDKDNITRSENYNVTIMVIENPEPTVVESTIEPTVVESTTEPTISTEVTVHQPTGRNSRRTYRYSAYDDEPQCHDLNLLISLGIFITISLVLSGSTDFGILVSLVICIWNSFDIMLCLFSNSITCQMCDIFFFNGKLVK